MSPRISLDLTEATEFSPLPEGTYPVKVIEINGPKKGARASYVEAIFEVVDGEYEGRKLYRNMPIEGKGAGIFSSFWKVATGDELELGGSIDVDPDDAIGAQMDALVTQYEYPEGSGEFRNEIKKLIER